MTISYRKTKLFVLTTGITDADLVPLSINCSDNESIPSFRCLESFLEGYGGVVLDHDDKIVRVLKALELLESLFPRSAPC